MSNKPAGWSPLTLKQILAWADAFRRRTGQWPSANAGPVSEAPGEKWQIVTDFRSAEIGVQGKRTDLTSTLQDAKLPRAGVSKLRAIIRASAVVQRLYDQDLLAVDVAGCAWQKKPGSLDRDPASIRDDAHETQQTNGPGGRTDPGVGGRPPSAHGPVAEPVRRAGGGRPGGELGGCQSGASGREPGLPGGDSLPRLLDRHRGPGGHGRPRPWTPEEDELMRVLSPPEVARRTGRTLPAVYSRRRRLELAEEPPGT
jgi:hypothetical protein